MCCVVCISDSVELKWFVFCNVLVVMCVCVVCEVCEIVF